MSSFFIWHYNLSYYLWVYKLSELNTSLFIMTKSLLALLLVTNFKDK